MADSVSALFRQVASNMTTVAQSDYPRAVSAAIELIYDAFISRRKLLVFGNGGSSADAQHFTAELVGRFAAARPALPAIALTTNQAILTAWSNDHSFDDVFARQIDAIGSPGDVAFGISTSGSSPNVVNALERARSRGLKTVGLSAGTAGRMGSYCDVLLAVPLTVTSRIQEVHLVTYHAICAAIEERIGAESRSH